MSAHFGGEKKKEKRGKNMELWEKHTEGWKETFVCQVDVSRRNEKESGQLLYGVCVSP